MTRISCKAKTTAGGACRAPALPGGLCYFHANPDRAKSLGQIGGRRNRKFGGVNLEVPENMTATDLRHLMTQAMRSLLAGELQAREAGALVQLGNLQQRLIATADLENRVSKLEQQKTQQEQEKESPLDPASTSSNMNDVETATSVNLEQVAEQQALCPSDADPSDRTGGQSETESKQVESDPAKKP